MARHVRIRVSGGWYHVCTRGHNREGIFCCPRDREHFLELVEEMRGRFRVHVCAYCIMTTHYHLLVRTPEANISRAIQWLNGSYGIWFNKAHDRSGHVFGERFKAILLENGATGLEVSVYIHMNPVATKALGLGKMEKAVQGVGLGKPPSKDVVERRLDQLRRFPWSSYRAYAGYSKTAEWLDCGELLGRMGKTQGEQASRYRALVEDRIRQGVEEDLWEQVRWGAVLGGERFARKVRGRIVVSAQSRYRRDLRRRRSFDEIVRMVERLKGEKWETFRDRHGDWGRDLALWAGRQYGGLRLGELAAKTGVTSDAAVSMAVKRLLQISLQQEKIQRAIQAISEECEK
jgi:putative transposase